MSQVKLVDDHSIVTLTIHGRRNATAVFELINELRLAEDVASNDHRVMILAGEGASFCAGMDLKGVLDDAQRMSGMLHGLSRAMRSIRRLAIPTIANVQGAAVGGGCGLAVVCDYALSHPEAKLGYPEVELGVCPAVVCHG